MPAALADATVSPPAAPPAETPAAETTNFAPPSPFLDVIEARIPAITIPPLLPGQENDVQNFAVQNFPELSELLEYVELPDLRSVFFNPKLTDEKTILAASEKGTLDELAPVAAELGVPPGTAPTAPPAPQEAPPAAAAPQTAGSKPLAGASVSSAGGPPANRTLERARLRNAAPPPPNTPGGPIPVLQRRSV